VVEGDCERDCDAIMEVETWEVFETYDIMLFIGIKNSIFYFEI
jgi:hypothetical protein